MPDACAAMLMCDQPALGFDDLRLGEIHALVIAGFVAEPAIPASGPEESDRAAGGEDGAPRHQRKQRRHQQWGQSAGKVRGGEEEALGPPALPSRSPAGKGEGRIRPRPGFARAEQEADDEQAGITPRETGGDVKQLHQATMRVRMRRGPIVRPTTRWRSRTRRRRSRKALNTNSSAPC